MAIPVVVEQGVTVFLIVVSGDGPPPPVMSPSAPAPRFSKYAPSITSLAPAIPRGPEKQWGFESEFIRHMIRVILPPGRKAHAPLLPALIISVSRSMRSNSATRKLAPPR